MAILSNKPVRVNPRTFDLATEEEKKCRRFSSDPTDLEAPRKATYIMWKDKATLLSTTLRAPHLRLDIL